MLLFKRILNFSKATVGSGDKRQQQRYPVGHPFPFKTILALIGHDGEGKPLPNDHKGQDWAGRLSNLSGTGASIQLHSAAVGLRGEHCIFKIRLDEYRLDIPSTVAHFRSYQNYALCGFSFNFPDFETEKAYLQLLEPVTIGASLVAVEAKKVRQDAEGLIKEEYVGTGSCRLHIWRQSTADRIHSFDFRMNDYGVRWSEGMTEVEPYGIKHQTGAGKKSAETVLHLTPTQLEDVRWLFCLAVPNLAKGVPADVRKFLTSLVAA